MCTGIDDGYSKGHEPVIFGIDMAKYGSDKTIEINCYRNRSGQVKLLTPGYFLCKIHGEEYPVGLQCKLCAAGITLEQHQKNRGIEPIISINKGE